MKGRLAWLVIKYEPDAEDDYQSSVEIVFEEPDYAWQMTPIVFFELED